MRSLLIALLIACGSPALAQDRQFYAPGYYFPPVPYAQPMEEYRAPPRPAPQSVLAPIADTPAFDRVAVAWSACLERAEAKILPLSDSAPFAEVARQVMWECSGFERRGFEALQDDGMSRYAAERRMRDLVEKARSIVFADMDKRLTGRR